MPEPGSHQYDVARARRRKEHSDEGMSDEAADRVTQRELQRDNPPRRPADDRAEGPLGERPSGEPGGKGRERDREGGGIHLRSSTFNDHDVLPRWCSKDGEDIAPTLEWDGVPDDAVELAVVCADPDAPNGTFLHWLVSSLPPSVDRIDHGEAPGRAVESRNDFGEYGWSGPMPPVGDAAHRYFFHVFASNRPLNLGAESGLDELYRALADSEVARGTIVGLYQR
ncbi:YbhB/YbcL family Raf kinase inhibitor-like protein [Saccharopolyspora endophytica]|uniref:YbhB/YbcL family Raf kinase inhibitor-like protein n=1 Tax=Saccharopolyspora endophytica TaxID=543886 RepID=UPI001FE458A0|nr:YbhB/YbcL family Raf kinase inhibitor-like protein [Saccharopolyspora endophytica]